MEYNHIEIEKKWQRFWKENRTYAVTEDPSKEKFYVLDMFPYPSGAGLHVGHPLGYIASDIVARYKRLKGYNVLHPMGYDSFGLPAEQYAIQTGQHPAITTEQNIQRYRTQLDRIGFSFDWEREVRTSEPSYYKWTQWIFKQLFNSWYNLDLDKAQPIHSLTQIFEKDGNLNIQAACEDIDTFSAAEWNSWDETQQEKVLLNYRLAYLADSWVNWCPALGTVLANDEVKEGVSERGGHPVEQKLMSQWSLRITAYADRLLEGLTQVDFSESLKEQQRNWIGKSKGASVRFTVNDHPLEIEVFTTRPDTIFGVSFMVLAPEHDYVDEITTTENVAAVREYQKATAARSERERQTEVKKVTGEFTGAFAIHPFSGKKIPIWISDYVLASYGTGAVMAVPAGDQRDWDFATHFNLEIPPIFENTDISESAYADKDASLVNSDFLNGLDHTTANEAAIKKIESNGIGAGKINYRLRDAIFSRQRYWGEPFPVYYEKGIPKLLSDDQWVTLPDVDAYLPTEEGEPPLARANKENWNVFQGDRMEYNTMPGWAGSSWYFLRYMDPHNQGDFASKEKMEYWNQVDLYVGGAEHAVGHLLYSRFWTKFLYDLGYISFDEPFKKLINQGMIQGRSNFVYRVKNSNQFVSFGKRKEYDTVRLHVDINLVKDDILDIENFKKWRPEFAEATFVLEDGRYVCGSEVEKMSKSKFNVQTPDLVCDEYGADALRLYEMFLGPLTDSKPWNTSGISGVTGFLKKLWRLFHNENSVFISSDAPSEDELKVLHRTIQKVESDILRFSFNTVVSNLMIAVNELTALKCNNASVLKDLTILLSPYAPHMAEELWSKLGMEGSVSSQSFPAVDEQFLVEDSFTYPVSFNGKMRFKIDLPSSLSKEEIETEVLAYGKTSNYLNGQDPKKVIVVPKRIINIVV
ncbi:MAG TPA: leucine--tRNA ligase [Flavobacteriales bacterium]|nr:leucine--tRNA ligase [Flavobacteriales bacterium]